MKFRLVVLLYATIALACSRQHQLGSIVEVEQWKTHEIKITSDAQLSTLEDQYTNIDIWAVFTNERGDEFLRPAFLSKENTWKVRFASPDNKSIWSYEIFSDPQVDLAGGTKGRIRSVPNKAAKGLTRKGLLKMSDGKRSVVHHNGSPFLVVADTPWALPFRATVDQAKVYAKDRRAKGFNAALLMSIQPDMEAEGPNERNTPQGFARGFADLHEGHINQIQPVYFDYLDSLVQVLLDHEIVPVFQPVFHGYGWKGKKVLGNHIVPEEYVRYCKYLLARYGSQPAMWLLAGDNGGDDPGVKEAGEMMEKWDAYKQPTGLHYNPCDDYVADWAVDNPIKHCNHFNKVHQEKTWLDFQWAQSGHDSKHLFHKVERMYNNLPTKASANGEPTYEGMANGKNGLGWWQGEEAWGELMHGGTMGVFYGAAGLWQWMVSGDEEGWPDWTNQNKSWQEAMQMDGSTYVGLVGKILNDYDLTDIEMRTDLSQKGEPILADIGYLYILYTEESVLSKIKGVPEGLPFKYINPKTGEVTKTGVSPSTNIFIAPKTEPRVLIIGEPMSEKIHL